MIAILALFIIILGLYLIFSGLKEDVEFQEVEEWKEENYEGGESYRRERKTVKGGGVILIGPIPIVFGDSKYAAISLILAIVLMFLSIFLILFLQI